MSSSVCVVGAFPPPVNGMALINAAVRDELSRRGVRMLVLDMAPPSIARTLRQRARRLPRVARAFAAYCCELVAGRVDTLYVGLSAGWGQLYEAAFVGLARIGGARLFLHHHSFTHVEKRRLPARLLVNVAGPSAIHIVLCDVMETRLRQQYPVVDATRVVSNAALTPTGPKRVRSRLGVVGFLGNISRSKGILDVLTLARSLAEYGIHTRIAGPFEDEALRSDVARAAAELPELTYVGPQYGVDKEKFLDSIDALLFPSTLMEAAPLVVLEALGSGIPVVARERGCIASMINGDAGSVIARESDFTTDALDRILDWHRHPEKFRRASDAAISQSLHLVTEARACLNRLLDELCRRSTHS